MKGTQLRDTWGAGRCVCGEVCVCVCVCVCGGVGIGQSGDGVIGLGAVLARVHGYIFVEARGSIQDRGRRSIIY